MNFDTWYIIIQIQEAGFNCDEGQYKLFDLKLSIFVCFVCFISFILVSVWIPKARVSISIKTMSGVGNCQAIQICRVQMRNAFSSAS